MLESAAGSFLILQNHSTINIWILRRLAGGPGHLYLRLHVPGWAKHNAECFNIYGSYQLEQDTVWQ